jgi:murein DD-endopeptidase MepM/ murein hydrolase activator NlpD
MNGMPKKIRSAGTDRNPAAAGRAGLRFAFAILTVIAAVIALRTVAPSYNAPSNYESQLMTQVENKSRKFSRNLERIVFEQGFMRAESRDALKRLVDWLNDNRYARISEFLDILSREDARTLFEAFKRERTIGSDELLPVMENGESYGQATSLMLPFHGMFFIIQGNDGSVSHLKSTSNEFALDMLMMKSGFMYSGATHKNKNYYAWGLPVLAPAPGRILKTENNQPDHPPLTTKMGGANYVLIQHDDGEVSVIYHLMQGSVSVAEGDTVARGDEIGKIGDSGISMFPHIHYQLDRPPSKKDSAKRLVAPARFACYFARREGDPDWHLVISGIPEQKQYIVNVHDFITNNDIRNTR